MLNMDPYDPAIPLLGMYPTETSAMSTKRQVHVHNNFISTPVVGTCDEQWAWEVHHFYSDQ